MSDPSIRHVQRYHNTVQTIDTSYEHPVGADKDYSCHDVEIEELAVNDLTPDHWIEVDL